MIMAQTAVFPHPTSNRFLCTRSICSPELNIPFWRVMYNSPIRERNVNRVSDKMSVSHLKDLLESAYVTFLSLAVLGTNVLLEGLNVP